MPTGLIQQSTAAVGLRSDSEHVLHIDEPTFRKHFEHEPFLIEHSLPHHDLFALPRLVELSQQLPEKSIEYNAGTVPVNNPNMELTPRTGLSVQETIERIENCRSWMVMKNVEQNAKYRRLLDRCLDDLTPYLTCDAANMVGREGFIFITSPGSVTPYHMDPEYNFLLQVRGRKTVHQFDVRDRSVVSEENLEEFYTKAPRNKEFAEEKQQKAMTFDLTAGKGLYFPPTNPHWVQNGGEVSISFSITWYTPSLERRGSIYKVNAALRRWGLKPKSVGVSPFRDVLKDRSFRAWRRVRRLFRLSDD